MAFGWLKKVVTAPVGIVKKALPIVTVLKPVLVPVYKIIVPYPVRKVVANIGMVGNIANRAVKLIKKRKGSDMSELEKKFRDALSASLALSGKSGIDLALSSAMTLQQMIALALYVRGMDIEQLLADAQVALDNMVGSEVNALIGPDGQLVQIDIPFVDDEKMYDLILSGAKSLLEQSTGPDSPTG